METEAPLGRVKDDWMEAEERGWNEVEKHVCADCVDEPDIWRLAEGKPKQAQCNYCQNNKAVLPVAAVQDILYSVMRAYYAEPAQAGVPYDEGSYAIEPIYTDEVLEILGFDPVAGLLEDVLDADAVEAWVPAANGHWADIHEHQVKLGAWSTFAHVVKHHTRFHFQRMTGEYHPQEIQVADMLEVIARELAPLIRTVDAGTRVFRARHLTDAEIKAMDAGMMGAPPKEFASAGRMNPAGISYFYASCDARTALLEIGDPPIGKTASAAMFALSQPLRVVDLTQLPSAPSVFAIDLKNQRERAIFLEGFVRSITRPVSRDGREHIDYVPSQVVCEYLAQAFSIEDGKSLDGLIFPSVAHPGGINLVVFPLGAWFQRDRFSALNFLGPV